MTFRTVYGYSTSENGWRMCDRNECDIVRIPDLFLTDTAPLRRGSPLTILGAWLYWYDRNVEEISSSVWGWSATNDVPSSNHLAGTAVDINAPKYPWGKRVMPADRIAKIREGLKLFEGTVFWGADWSRADEMHFQMAFPEGDARNEAFAQKLLAGYLGIYGKAADPAVAVLGRATGLSAAKAASILPAISSGLREAKCTNVNRIAMFLAQTGHESDGFNTTEEYAKNGRYAPYIGRTWIQITWDYNYRSFGRWCHERGLVNDPETFVKQPASLADIKWAGIGAAWYWTAERPLINAYSDDGDVVRVTQFINGGQNGLADRRRRFDLARAQGDQLLSLLQSGDDDLAQVPQDQWDLVFREQTQQHDSLSPYRAPGEGKVGTWCTLDRNVDLMMHILFVESSAQIGDVDSIYRLARASVGRGADTSQSFKTRAARALAKVPKEYLEPALAAIEKTDPATLQDLINRGAAK